MQLKIKNDAVMQNFGAKLAQACEEGTIIFLQGDLGAGKTTLVRGFLRGFGFIGTVRSPTFTLVEPYIFATKTIYHFDLYRLVDAEELEFIGFRDYFSDTTICLLEWPEKGGDYLPTPDLIIRIAFHGKARVVEIMASTAKGVKLIQRIKE